MATGVVQLKKLADKEESWMLLLPVSLGRNTKKWKDLAKARIETISRNMEFIFYHLIWCLLLCFLCFIMPKLFMLLCFAFSIDKTRKILTSIMNSIIHKLHFFHFITFDHRKNLNFFERSSHGSRPFSFSLRRKICGLRVQCRKPSAWLFASLLVQHSKIE